MPFNFPPELLLEFFYFAVNDPSVRRSWDPVHPPLRTMLTITHVCREWRYIGLEDSSLWKGCVDLGRPLQCIEEILFRAGTRPLHLTFFVPGRPQQKLVSGFLHKEFLRREPKVVDHAHREYVRTLREYALSRTRLLHVILPLLGHRQVFDNFKAHLPRMEIISLESESSSAPLWEYRLFDEEWRVRVLTLKRCSIRLQAPALPFLQELRVEFPATQVFSGVVTWLTLLAGLPRLRVFELTECGAYDTSHFHAPPDMKVHMANLESLVLKTSQTYEYICGALLNALVISPSCALILCTPILHSTPSYKVLLSALSERYSAYDNSLGNRLNVTITDNVLVMQTQGPSARAETYICLQFVDGCRHRRFHNDCPKTKAGLIFQTVFEALRKPISAIRWLSLRTYVHRDNGINPFFNLRLLRKFPRLKWIVLNVESIFGDSAPSNSSPLHPSPQIFWSPAKRGRKRRLIISNFDFDRWDLLHTLGLALMRHLKPGLEKRWDSERGIKKLTFRECVGIRTWQLAKLEELVGIKYKIKIKCVDCKVLDLF